MTGLGQQITFGQLVAHHKRVQIPIIQRDYAQGRASEQGIREEFLKALYQALTLPVEDSTLPLNLDFIYGSVESNDTTRFQPLDGQQRLTTLFLLHWYLASLDECHRKFVDLFSINGKSRFSYTVRPSSAEFYNELVQYCPNCALGAVNSVGELVIDQSWYFRYWRLDPTIQSSLTMLDAIHDLFRETKGLYKRITDAERPAITFQLLDLNNFGLSDDLYIKMNARGKPLTEFETFKARYEQQLKEKFGAVRLPLSEDAVPVAELFSQRIDTIWADFFWTHRNVNTNLYDEVVMNLIRLVVLLSRDPNSDSYSGDVSSLRSPRLKSSYSTFHNRGWLDENFLNILVPLLETWTKDENTIASLLPDDRYFNSTAVVTKAMNDPVGLNFTELVQLVGYTLFVREHFTEIDPEHFQEWMRIIVNLSINSTYDRPSDMQRSITGIITMLPNSADILGFFGDNERPTVGFSTQQISEEKLKAELLLADPNWRTVIDRAETHPYFKGQIEFLFDFCGVLAKSREAQIAIWDPAIHRSLQEKFSRYFAVAETMFGSQGLKHVDEYRWQRALLSIGDYLLPSGRQNVSFLSNSATEPASWKRLLRGTGLKAPESRRVLHQLFDRLDACSFIVPQLDEIIHTATSLEVWRQAFVETPEAFLYCKRQAIRLNLENDIYLLTKTQMNGLHAELFTYWLFHRKLLPAAQSGKFLSLELDAYGSVIGTDTKPHILMSWRRGENQLKFFIEWRIQTFIIFVQKEENELLSQLDGAIRNEVDFIETDGILGREVDWADFPSVLIKLANVLSSKSDSLSTMEN